MSTALSTFGGRDEVKELGYRLQKMMPSAQSFTGDEALAVAQIAYAHGLDPFNGEVWGIKDAYKNKWYGVMVGIKGLRKCARRAAADDNSSYWLSFILTEASKYNYQEDGAVVYECELRDAANMQAYGQAIHQLTTSGIPYKEAVEMVGSPPVVVGIGMAHPGERSKMSLHQRAKKRAEADALKTRYDVDFGSAVFTVEDDAEAVIEASAEITPDAFDQSVDEAFPKDEAEILVELGFVETKAVPHPDLARPYSAEIVKQKVEQRINHHLDNKTLASANDRKVLASILDTALKDVTKRYELCTWLVCQASTQKMKQADVNALFDWLQTPKQFNAVPSAEVVKEIHACHTAALLASGQQPLIKE